MRKPAQSTGWAEPSEENSAAPTTRLIRLIDMLWHFLKACSSRIRAEVRQAELGRCSAPWHQSTAQHWRALPRAGSLFPISDPQQASDMLRWGQGGKSFWRGF